MAELIGKMKVNLHRIAQEVLKLAALEPLLSLVLVMVGSPADRRIELLMFIKLQKKKRT